MIEADIDTLLGMSIIEIQKLYCEIPYKFMSHIIIESGPSLKTRFFLILKTNRDVRWEIIKETSGEISVQRYNLSQEENLMKCDISVKHKIRNSRTYDSRGFDYNGACLWEPVKHLPIKEALDKLHNAIRFRLYD